MKKRPAARKPKTFSNKFGLYFYIGLAVFLLIILGGKAVSAVSKVHVLGIQTGPVVLADKSNPEPPDQEGQVNTNSGSQDVTVDCIGPDGKHLTVSLSVCQELNAQNGKSQTIFTPLSPMPLPTVEQGQGEVGTNAVILPTQANQHSGQLEVQTEGGKGELNLETNGTHMQAHVEDNGSISFSAQTPDGKEVQLKSDSTLSSVNLLLKEKDIELGSSSAGLVIKNKGVNAQATLPVAIDPSTGTLSVTTPNGEKSVTVLPSQAVQNVLTQGLLTNVQSSANSTSGTPSAVVSLTSLNNTPVFAVAGVSDKKLLGIFPVAYAKTAYVSAENGNVVQVDQTPLTKLLELISF